MRSTLALFAKSAIIAASSKQQAASSKQQAASVDVCDGSNLTFLFQQSKKPTKITKLNKNFCVLARVFSRAYVCCLVRRMRLAFFVVRVAWWNTGWIDGETKRTTRLILRRLPAYAIHPYM